MLKVFIITQNEPFYIPKMISYLIYNINSNYSIVGFTVLKPTRKNKSIFYWIEERIKIYYIRELTIVTFLFLYCRLFTFITRENSPYSVRNIFIKNKITEIVTDDINSTIYLNKLSSINPDIILSISCPQLFKERILTIPQKYCINAHGTLLPRHRGVFGSWWTLFNNDKEAGSSLHTMELRLDAGKILWQQSFPVDKNDTQYSIAYKTKKQMTLGLLELFKQIDNQKERIIEPIYETSYHRAPTKKEGKLFHRKGYKIITLSNIGNILTSTFK
ncbi:MAG: hypothetical protein JW723_15505 [Bacteroidales bacterium]|nr:hypothetical protein [Bacteroidales bacterium]